MLFFNEKIHKYSVQMNIYGFQFINLLFIFFDLAINHFNKLNNYGRNKCK